MRKVLMGVGEELSEFSAGKKGFSRKNWRKVLRGVEEVSTPMYKYFSIVKECARKSYTNIIGSLQKSPYFHRSSKRMKKG